MFYKMACGCVVLEFGVPAAGGAAKALQAVLYTCDRSGGFTCALRDGGQDMDKATPMSEYEVTEFCRRLCILLQGGQDLAAVQKLLAGVRQDAPVDVTWPPETHR